MADKLTAATTADAFDDIDEQDVNTLAGDDTQGYTDDSSVPNEPKNGGKKGGGKKGGGNKGVIIGISVAVGVAVVLGVGYFSFVKKEAPAKAKTVTRKAPETLPVAPTPMAPVVTNDSPESKTAEDFLTRGSAAPLAVINDVATEVIAQAPVASVQAPVLEVPPQPFIPVAPAPQPAPVPVDIFAPAQELAQIPTNTVFDTPPEPVAPVQNAITQEIPVIIPVEAPVQVQDTSINSMFDSMATRVDAIATRVDGLEKFKAAQENLNAQFEKRIDRLEGFHEGDKACNCDKSSKNGATGTVTPKKVTKPAVKKVENRATPKPKPVAKPKPKTTIDGDVLVDKTKTRSPSPAVKKPAPLEEYQFHSIYDNRVWLKNPDGSLSTFTVGNKLPSGEIIKEVSHETFEVVTNKRTIRKN